MAHTIEKSIEKSCKLMDITNLNRHEWGSLNSICLSVDGQDCRCISTAGPVRNGLRMADAIPTIRYIEPSMRFYIQGHVFFQTAEPYFNLSWEVEVSMTFAVLISVQAGNSRILQIFFGLSIVMVLSQNGWFISWKIPWKWRMTGGTPMDWKPPEICHEA